MDYYTLMTEIFRIVLRRASNGLDIPLTVRKKNWKTSLTLKLDLR